MRKVHGHTSFFALFEGGGAKGIAYAGALRACAKFGIRFEGACGVSAGSIAAAFVAAQISPFEIARLLSVPISEILQTGQSGRVKRTLAAIGRVARLEGMKTSAGIEHWVDGHLRNALGLNRAVRFEDLRRPLAILAYDIADGVPKVWSKSSTRDAEVALAVRASCSIPFLFSAAEAGLAKYVDGGVLNNLPLFLIEELTQQIELPTIAFRLKSSSTVIKPAAIPGMKAKAAAAVGKAIDARAALPDAKKFEVKTVEIDCGNIGTADFDLSKLAIRKLMRQGVIAVHDCLSATEVARNTSAMDDRVHGEGLRVSRQRHATLARTGRLLTGARKQVSIFGGDVSWLEELAPYLLLATKRGVQARLLTSRASVQDIQHALRLGVTVGNPNESEAGRLRCTIVDAGEPFAEALLVEKEHALSPLIYSAAETPRLLTHLSHSFDRLWSTAVHTPAHRPQLRALSSEDIMASLRHVRQYMDADVRIEELKPTDVLPACAYVETFKLDRLERVGELYEQYKAEFGYHIRGTPWYSILPIVERRPEGTLVVIDGTHRFYSAFRAHRAVRCFVVSCGAELPSKPMKDWSLVQLTTAKLDRALRFVDFKQDQFRHIKRTLASEFSRADPIS